MTDKSESGLKGAVLQIITTVVISGLLSGFSVYVAIASKLAVLEYKIDEFIEDTKKLKIEVVALQLREKDLISNDKQQVQAIDGLKERLRVNRGIN